MRGETAARLRLWIVGLDATQRAWVEEIRGFLHDNVTPALESELAEHGLEVIDGEVTAFRRRVGERGWFGVTWPREYGGLGPQGNAPAPADAGVRIPSAFLDRT